MASYRPKIKLNASGETRDLPLDAETLKGKTLDYFASKSEMNSGLANKQNNLSQTQLEAVNSGITSDKVNKYDAYENKINDKATASNVYSKTEVDSKDTNTLNNAKSYTDTQLKTITDNITKDVICSHQYEITGNTGDEHGLAVEDQQMIIKKIEGQTKVVNGRLVNSNCVLKSSGRNLISSPFVSGKLDINNGNYVNDSNYLCSRDFIKWETPNQKITVDLDKTYQDTWFIEYDINKNMVETGGWFLSQTRTFTPSSECKYFKLSIKSNDLSTLKCVVYYGDKRNDVLDESYKQDTIDGIGSLGQWDYIDMISQKKVLPTSDIVTLNGNEIWFKAGVNQQCFATNVPNTYQSVVEITVVSTYGNETTAANIYNGAQGIGTADNLIYFDKDGIDTIDQLKQWLAQNPIQLVYKKTTPTQVPINLQNGMAVYNGGLQSQIGDVPYKITKQYNLNQKAQTLANIEIDREQQGQINEIKALNLGWEVIADNMKKHFSGDGTGSTLDTDIQNKMSDMNAIYALTFDASGGSSTDDFITKTQYGTIYLSNQIDNYYGKKVLIGNGSIISRTFGLYVITAIYSDGSLNVLTQDVQKRSSAVYLQTIKKLVLKK